jgi:hypothetical protein
MTTLETTGNAPLTIIEAGAIRGAVPLVSLNMARTENISASD